MFPSTSSRETLRFSGTKFTDCSPQDQSLSVYCFSLKCLPLLSMSLFRFYFGCLSWKQLQGNVAFSVSNAIVRFSNSGIKDIFHTNSTDTLYTSQTKKSESNFKNLSLLSGLQVVWGCTFIHCCPCFCSSPHFLPANRPALFCKIHLKTYVWSLNCFDVWSSSWHPG